MPTDPVAIARDLIRCRSVTPAEGGALGLLESVLARAGFVVERVTFTEPGFADVQNLYARIGAAPPHFVFATPMSFRPATSRYGRIRRSEQISPPASSTGAAPST